MKNLDGLNSVFIGLELNENEIESVGGGCYDPYEPGDYLITILSGPLKYDDVVIH